MNDLAKKQDLPAMPTGSWGGEQASSKDMIIPRINLMQDISKLVKDGKAKAGQIVNGTTGEVMGGVDKKIEIIPVLTFAEWLNYEVTEERGKKKDIYVGKMLCDKTNENLPTEGFENGKPIRRVRQINVLCLEPSKLDELPFIVSFKKTGTMAGKKLSTHFQVCAMKGAVAAGTVFNLFSSLSTMDSYTFYRFEVETGRRATEPEVATAYKWYLAFKQGEAKAADDELEAAPF